MSRCEKCDGTGETEKWNQSSGVYQDAHCPWCHGTGQIEHGSEQMNEMNPIMDAGEELVWKCDTCGHQEPVGEGDYRTGDSEPCVNCESGTAEVVPATDLAPETCEHCGAPLGMPCAPGCPNQEIVEPDPDRYREGISFDKFMDSTLIMEHSKKRVDATKVSPQRQLARNYQEHPLGKVRVGGRRAR